MITHLTFRIPDNRIVSLCFTRLTEDDNWVCQMPNETMKDLQAILGKDFYESL
jgi:hypothetical protein